MKRICPLDLKETAEQFYEDALKQTSNGSFVILATTTSRIVLIASI